MRDYSQSGEQAILTKVFAGHVGCFLDIGACDGKTGSNTMALVELGWSGVLFEPSPRAFLKLQELHGNNPRLTLVHAAIGTVDKFSPFWDGPGPALGYATTEDANRAKWNRHCSFQRPFYIPVISLKAALDAFPGPLDFISFDTEGTSVELFTEYFAIPKSVPLPKVICVEHDERIAECLAISNKYGYREVARNPQNLVLVRE